MKFPSLYLSVLVFQLGTLCSLHAETLMEVRFDALPEESADGRLRLRDESGNGRDVAINGAAEQSDDVPFAGDLAGKGNRSFYNPGGDLGGFGGDVANAASLRLDTHQAFTIEGWVKWNEGAGGLCRITGPGLMIWLAWTAQGELYLTYGGGTVVNTGVRLPQGEWAHVAYTFGDGQFTLYLHGEEQVTGEVSAEAVAALGNGVATVHLFEADGVLKGGADDFRISDQALKPEELGVHRPFGEKAP